MFLYSWWVLLASAEAAQRCGADIGEGTAVAAGSCFACVTRRLFDTNSRGVERMARLCIQPWVRPSTGLPGLKLLSAAGADVRGGGHRRRRRHQPARVAGPGAREPRPHRLHDAARAEGGASAVLPARCLPASSRASAGSPVMSLMDHILDYNKLPVLEEWPVTHQFF